MINKQLVKNRFSKSLPTYAKSAIAQAIMADKLYQSLSKYSEKYSRIFEVGCGCGFLTNIMTRNCSWTRYLANDIVPECGTYIKKYSDKIDFLCADIEKYEPNEKFDLIISNATLQWTDINIVIPKLYEMLAPDGVLAFSTFGDKNYIEIRTLLNKSLPYYTPQEFKEILKNYNILKFEEEILTLEFPTPIDVLRHIKNTGTNAIENFRFTKTQLKDFINDYQQNFATDSGVQLTYYPFYVVIKKHRG